MPHRRQYIPHSRVTVSRAELKVINERLRAEIEEREEQKRSDAQRRSEEAKRRETTGMRGFLNRTKKFLTQPVRLPRRRSA